MAETGFCDYLIAVLGCQRPERTSPQVWRASVCTSTCAAPKGMLSLCVLYICVCECVGWLPLLRSAEVRTYGVAETDSVTT